jgi:large subunit ribosomal protein L4
MKLDVYNLSNEKVGEVEVSDSVFGAEVKPHLHYEMVRYQMARRRSGTHAVLTRGAVSGSTRKLYKQKGTGNARHGSIKSPTYVGGGIVHGPQPRDYAFKLPRKVRRGALVSVLSQKAGQGQLKVVSSMPMEAPRTRVAVGYLASLGVNKAVVVDVNNENLKLSIRNLPNAKYLQTEGINVYDLLAYDTLVVTEEAIRHIDGVLK